MNQGFDPDSDPDSDPEETMPLRPPDRFRSRQQIEKVAILNGWPGSSVRYCWTGVIDGKRTTKTISRETAIECQRRIKRFRKLQRQIERMLRASLRDAPWTEEAET